jgi:hypothetical protein
MNRFKLSSFKPALQVQLFLATLFRLQEALHVKQTTASIMLLIEPIRETYPWQQNSGILHQLKFQIDYLLQVYSEELLNPIQKILDKAFESCETSQGTEWALNLFNSTAEFLNNCDPDENLYYFLLRHKEECKKTFGRVFLLTLFKKKHLGLKQTEQFLIEKYQERGFFHLKTSIRQHLAGLTRC